MLDPEIADYSTDLPPREMREETPILIPGGGTFGLEAPNPARSEASAEESEAPDPGEGAPDEEQWLRGKIVEISDEVHKRQLILAALYGRLAVYTGAEEAARRGGRDVSTLDS